ncbi:MULTISPECIES: sensor domain-containing diguanylate cyclase [Stenotrophomonas]|uniref:sensor domain-containing diguanylate cyclase n=1 Tax=Stenotrophomonas TaxID=40323 RepID=UPI00087277CD|nr:MULTISPECIES: sensor domain-containing diguanylate cyclase [Stenotrophomonas]OEZ02642.1 diguanylate cyclase [Stenotrophomonas sp. BIIR7]
MTERERQAALEYLRILDSDPEPFFDALTRAAHAMTGMPIAMISLIDGNRQWFKSLVGIDGASETARDISFCTWAIQSDMVLEVQDASEDPRFAHNPIVQGPPFVRHYLGAPIRVQGGNRIGTLCLLDTAPGQASAGQREALAWLAQVAAFAMEQRASLLNRMAEQRQASEALSQSEARYRRLFQHSLGLICTHTLDGIITSVNPAASASLDRPEAELVGHSLAEIIPEERQHLLQGYLERIAENQSDSGVMELLAEDGSRRYWAYHNILDTEASPHYVLGHAQDITTQHLQERQLMELSIRDPLTRSFNRRYLAELAENQPEAWGCLVFDLDHFKEINDTQGHAHGDSVLVDFVAFLSEPLQEGEVVVRLGGDEFLVFVPGATLDRLQALEAEYQDRAYLSPIRFSGGCAINRPSETVADTINRADMKLYERRRRERPPSN